MYCNIKYTHVCIVILNIYNKTKNISPKILNIYGINNTSMCH